MTVGVALVLIAIGAILKYAVTASISGIELETVGTILLIIGVIGLVIALLYELSWSRRARGEYVREAPPPPRDRY